MICICLHPTLTPHSQKMDLYFHFGAHMCNECSFYSGDDQPHCFLWCHKWTCPQIIVQVRQCIIILVPGVKVLHNHSHMTELLQWLYLSFLSYSGLPRTQQCWREDASFICQQHTFALNVIRLSWDHALKDAIDVPLQMWITWLSMNEQACIATCHQHTKLICGCCGVIICG